MAPVRIVLGSMPALLGDIVRETLAGHPEFEILAEVSERGDISQAVERTAADVAVVAVEPRDHLGERATLPDELLAAHPRLRLIALTSDGRTAYVYELRPREAAIVGISPQSLLEAVRGARTRRS